ncbi:hypothetical protein Y032_0023g821 [Ancylostoma ceylanicum]|uniref:Uncharacterized protein n=1 Tax=Ancylostoma ceylanicum TaxID=53326 RepID=A0A016UYB9_9BILA|nr:hypothetical protein Y032_0023g821 [Ancylostoma ceylanicum]
MRKKGRNQSTLIGTFGQPASPICLTSSSVNAIMHGLFALSAVRVKEPQCITENTQDKRVVPMLNVSFWAVSTTYPG